MYLSDNDYYTMGGTATVAAFPRYAFRAEQLVNAHTHNRIKAMTEIPQAVKYCMVELVNAMATTDPTTAAVSPTLTGFNNDGYSESYAGVTAESLTQAYSGIIRDYLSCECDDNGTPLLYAGVDA